MASVTFLTVGLALVITTWAEQREDCGALVTLKTEKHVQGKSMLPFYSGPFSSARLHEEKLQEHAEGEQETQETQETQEMQETGHLEQLETQFVLEKKPIGAVIFYHLFIRSEAEIPKVSQIAYDQLSIAQRVVDDDDVSEIRINSIGAPVNISNFNLSPKLTQRTKLRAHFAEGWENLTLRDLWSFCREKDTSPNQLVVYLHSKGSFHGDPDGASKSRNYLTSGALSQECMRMPKQCNVCSTRMTPIPQPHTPGNMWAARCGYIAKLMDPKDFKDKMTDNKLGPHNGSPWCVGRGRWADEHWVHSHPDVAPCDLDTNQSYVTPQQISSFPHEDFEKKLAKAPRFPLETYHVEWKGCPKRGEVVEDRLVEYEFLYDKVPPKDWWGWSFFNLTNTSKSFRTSLQSDWQNVIAVQASPTPRPSPPIKPIPIDISAFHSDSKQPRSLTISEHLQHLDTPAIDKQFNQFHTPNSPHVK